MQSQTLSPRLSRALHQIVNYRTAQLGNEDVHMILRNLIEKENFSTLLFDVLPQVDNLFDFIECAAEECNQIEETNVSDDLNRRPPFRAVIDWIAALISPACIYQLSGGVTEDDVIDLIIVLHQSEKKSFNVCEGLINVMNANNRIVNFTLFKMQQLNKYIEEGSIFYTKTCRPERMVYQSGTEQVRFPPSIDLALLKARATGNFKAGYNRGLWFLKGAQHYIGYNYKEMAAFMLQQAAELTLRAVILAITGIDMRNHSIEVLLRYCSRFAPQLSALFPGDSGEADRLTELLETAYLKARYTEEFIITTTELMLLNEKISRLLDLAATTVGRLIHDFEPTIETARPGEDGETVSLPLSSKK
jgi:HEPN domain-containing protein